MIKHISFDVWGTLIAPNKAFSILRTQLISNFYGCTPQKAKESYTEIKSYSDKNAERYGTGYDTKSLYIKLDQLLSTKPSDLNDLEILRTSIDGLFNTHHPEIISETTHTLHMLSKCGYTLSIGSNSNFISGTVMLPFLKAKLVNIAKFKFSLFSDLTLIAKPNILFFNSIIDETQFLYKKTNPQQSISSKEILHVGDHEVCDAYGAVKAGMKSFLISSPKDITKIWNYL